MTVSVQLETSAPEAKPPKYLILGFARASDHTASAIAAEGGGASCSWRCSYRPSSGWRSCDWSSRMFTSDLTAELIGVHADVWTWHCITHALQRGVTQLALWLLLLGR